MGLPEFEAQLLLRGFIEGHPLSLARKWERQSGTLRIGIRQNGKIILCSALRNGLKQSEVDNVCFVVSLIEKYDRRQHETS